MTSDTVRFAIVGLGYGATRCEMAKTAAGATLVAVADANEDRARQGGEKSGVPWYTDYRYVLDRDDVDVVALYTPSGLHRDMTIEVAGAGKHVLTTKPIEVTAARANEMVAACDTAGVRLFCEYHLRYRPDNLKIYDAIKSGALGRLAIGEFSFKCFRPQSYYEGANSWRGTWQYNGGGVMMNQTVHMVDKLTWLMGPVESVQSIAGTYAHQIEVEDTAAALLRMASGAIGIVIGTTTFKDDSPVNPFFGGGHTARTEVNGERGTVTEVNEAITMWRIDGPQAPAETGRRPANVFEDVASSLTTSGYTSPTLVTGRDAIYSVEVVEAIYRAVESGRSTPVNTESTAA